MERLIDDRVESYKKLGDVVTAIVRRHGKVDVDATSAERWHDLMGLLREVDTEADDTGMTSQEMMERLTSFEAFADRYPSLRPDELGAEAQATLLVRARHVFRLGELLAETQSVRRFVALRTLEARESTMMFGDVATPQVARQPQFYGKAMPALCAVGEVATLLDSLYDARQDVRDGKQALKPSPEYYARLSGAVAVRLKLGGKALLHVEPLKYLTVQWGMRTKNRIRNGVPEYSSLRRFKRGV